MPDTKKLMHLTTACYENIERAEVLINVLKEKYLTEKDTIVILEILSTNIYNLTNLVLEIQNEAR